MQPTVRPRNGIDLAHPLGVALGEIVVDRNDMDAFAGEGIQINRERGDEGLAFAGLHLGNVAGMEDHAADQLNVEMALAEGPRGSLAHGREGFRQDGRPGSSPCLSRSLRAGVIAFSSASDFSLKVGSSALISATRFQNGRNLRSFELPKNRCAIPLKPSMKFLVRPGGRFSPAG